MVVSGVKYFVSIAACRLVISFSLLLRVLKEFRIKKDMEDQYWERGWKREEGGVWMMMMIMMVVGQ